MLESRSERLSWLIVDLTEDPHNRKNRLEEGAVEKLEAEIDALKGDTSRPGRIGASRSKSACLLKWM